MNGCQGNTTACDGRDLRAVRLGLRREIHVWCSACRQVASGMGVWIVERRVADVPVALGRDRRRFIPTWRRNLPARDETASLLR